MPVDGCDVCVNHGARAPAVAAAATARVQRGIARGIAERAVMTYGLSTAIDPFDALKAELDRTNGHVLWLAGVVASLDPEELVWGKTLTEVGSGTGQREGNTAKARSEAAVNIWLKLYKEERQHLVKVSETCIACGLAEREVTLLESHGRLVADLLRDIFSDPALALPLGEQRRYIEVASRHLRSVGSS